MGRHVLYSSNDGEPITVFELDVPNEVLLPGDTGESNLPVTCEE